MCQICNLFKGENLIPTLIVVFAAFLVGMLVELIICKCVCSCDKKKGSSNGGKSRAGKKSAKDGEERFEKRHPAPADGSIEIYVGNLSYDLTEDQLRKEFEAYGTVNSARIITNRYNNKSKGFGFVQMPNRSEAEAAIKALDDKDILGRKLKCNEAKNLI